MSEPESISVLLPVHAGVASDHLAAALESLLLQTRPADEIVVVEDGPLLPAQLAVLHAFDQRHGNVVRIALPDNRGAGVANQTGLEAATGTWIAKADADDLSVATRFATQLALVGSAGLDLCGGAMLEFDSETGEPRGVRRRPGSHGAIAQHMRFNNPVNHPTAFYRRDLALAVGGYPPMRYMQDYVLFARMLAAGAAMRNTDEVLAHFRSGEGLMSRRRSSGLVALEWQLQRELHALGLVGRGRWIGNLFVRGMYRKLPRSLAWRVHRRALSPTDAPRLVPGVGR